MLLSGVNNQITYQMLFKISFRKTGWGLCRNASVVMLVVFGFCQNHIWILGMEDRESRRRKWL